MPEIRLTGTDDPAAVMQQGGAITCARSIREVSNQVLAGALRETRVIDSGV
jgi:hypothetical protein